jgi:hypothetical protein
MVPDEYQVAYYYTLKLQARSRVVNSLNRRIKSPHHRATWRGITLASITNDAIKFARTEWPKYYGDETHHGFEESWERLYHKFSANPAYFDLAIWQKIDGEDHLQGLALGKPSRGKTHLVINWVERSFAPTYLPGGVLLPTLACAEEYAKLLGCERVLIKDPVDPAVFGRYGYTHFDGPIGGPARVYWLCKEISMADVNGGALAVNLTNLMQAGIHDALARVESVQVSGRTLVDSIRKPTGMPGTVRERRRSWRIPTVSSLSRSMTRSSDRRRRPAERAALRRLRPINLR